MEPIRLIIVDDSDFVRDGLKIIFEIDEDFEVVGLAANGQEALELARKQPADVILMDLEMPVMDGIEATGYMVREGLGKVLVLTTFDDDERIQKALKQGAKGYLIKNHTPDKIKQMIKALHSGGNILDEKVLEKLVNGDSLKNTGFEEALFTPRELDIVKAIADGLSNREIAQKLFITEGTVKNHISAILEKSHTTHRTQIAVYYLTGKR